MCSMVIDPITLNPRIARSGGANGPASEQTHQDHLAAVRHSGNCREDIGLSGFRNRRAPPQGENAKRTVGEMEAAVCQAVARVEQDYTGRGPKDIRAHLLGDLLVVRLRGLLTAAEQHLAKSLSGAKGRDLLKQMRTHLIEMARPGLEAVVHEVTGVKVLSMHHDVSTVTGEKVVLFTLAELPDFRASKRSSNSA